MMLSLLFLVVLCASYVVAAPTWKSVIIGGGGYVTGLVAHPTTPGLTYIKTDVGGAYRSNGDGWIPITDNMNKMDYFGGDSIAVDPTNSSIVYLAAGMYAYSGSVGCVFKSVDRGDTWTCTSMKAKGAANGAVRFSGERLFVDLVNGSRLLFGTRLVGLHQSKDGALTWKQYDTNTIGLDAWEDAGITFIIGDPSSTQTTPIAMTKIIYLQNYNDSVYRSADGGDTWDSIGGPKFGLRGSVSPDGKYVYVSGGLGNTTGVSRYDTVAKTWLDITPANQTSAYVYNAIATHASNPKMLVACARSSSGRNPIYRSFDYGKTWDKISGNFSYYDMVPWWSRAGYMAAVSSIVIDPHDEDHAWITDFSGTYTTYNFTSPSPAWKNIEYGHEEVVTMAITSPPGGRLQSAVADMSGFNHVDLDTYPSAKRGDGDSTSVDYAGKNTSFLVAATSVRYQFRGGGSWSRDGGVTWKPFTNEPGPAGKITVSASGRSIVWAAMNTGLMVSKDNGESWVASKGDIKGILLVSAMTDQLIWNFWEPLYADRANDSVIYCAKWGTFYRSDDGGTSFKNVSVVPYTAGYAIWGVRASSRAGDVYYYTSTTLQRSTDYGNTWTSVDVTSVAQVGFGKSRTANGYDTLYLAGAVPGRPQGVHRSEDGGETWTTYDTSGLPVPLMTGLTGDGNTFGKVYVYTNGRGIFYATVLNATAATTTGSATTTKVTTSGKASTTTGSKATTTGAAQATSTAAKATTSTSSATTVKPSSTTDGPTSLPASSGPLSSTSGKPSESLSSTSGHVTSNSAKVNSGVMLIVAVLVVFI